jgi:CTP-dependent riboflavin kinase
MDHTDQELMKALLDGQYAYRTVPSLAEEIHMGESDAVRRLERMREQALAGKKTTPTRNLWFLTEKGATWLEAQPTPGESPSGRRVI